MTRTMAALPLITDQEHLMPMMARHFMPEWLAVIMIVGAIAAMMSTADSQLLASASAISEDIYRRLINPDADQDKLVALGRWATLGVGGVARRRGVIGVSKPRRG